MKGLESHLLLNANKEIIISAGAINSPAILQCSGIGDSSHLRNLGIDVIQNLPGLVKIYKIMLQYMFNIYAKNPLQSEVCLSHMLLHLHY